MRSQIAWSPPTAKSSFARRSPSSGGASWLSASLVAKSTATTNAALSWSEMGTGGAVDWIDDEKEESPVRGLLPTEGEPHAADPG
jgi:hypothetical protein